MADILARGLRFVKRAAAEQGGVISGDNPTRYLPTDPFRLWAIQAVLIIVTSRICYLALHRMKQPRVVAEIFGGIVLGPTLMGRIPGFSKTIFPPESLPVLQLCATLGLVLFLFIAALEIDIKDVTQQLRASAAVSVAGLVVPAAFGCLLALILYPAYADKDVEFGHFLLFTTIAVSITAFPILCRILTELGLFDTRLGVVVVSAGVGNDVVGWTLLALAVSLTNASSTLTPLWILLCCAGHTIICLGPIRYTYRWLALKSGSLQTGRPSGSMIGLAIVLLLANSFFTNIIGLHAIFGAFVTGLLIPHDNEFATNMMHQVEATTLNIFLPIYFTISGLRTDLGQLNTAKAWGYTILACLFAFLGKFIGCGIAARCTGFTTREAYAIGTLMTCKGLLELIVINLGLQAGILNTRLFAIFVVQAMVLTFSTTPLAAFFLPEKYRRKPTDTLRGEDSEVKDDIESEGKVCETPPSSETTIIEAHR